MNYTKGEWKAETMKDKPGKSLIFSDYGLIAEIWDNIIGCESNAHLISAAPDMYEALKESLNYIDANEENQDIVMQIGKALSKAEGK